MSPASAVFWFILFAGVPGVPTVPADMLGKTAVGPFPLEQCYAMGALIVDHLSDLHPDTDFAGACSKTMTFERQPGAVVLTAPQLFNAFEEITKDIGQ